MAQWKALEIDYLLLNARHVTRGILLHHYHHIFYHQHIVSSQRTLLFITTSSSAPFRSSSPDVRGGRPTDAGPNREQAHVHSNHPRLASARFIAHPTFGFMRTHHAHAHDGDTVEDDTRDIDGNRKGVREMGDAVAAAFDEGEEGCRWIFVAASSHPFVRLTLIHCTSTIPRSGFECGAARPQKHSRVSCLDLTIVVAYSTTPAPTTETCCSSVPMERERLGMSWSCPWRIIHARRPRSARRESDVILSCPHPFLLVALLHVPACGVLWARKQSCAPCMPTFVFTSTFTYPAYILQTRPPEGHAQRITIILALALPFSPDARAPCTLPHLDSRARPRNRDMPQRRIDGEANVADDGAFVLLLLAATSAGLECGRKSPSQAVGWSCRSPPYPSVDTDSSPCIYGILTLLGLVPTGKVQTMIASYYATLRLVAQRR
ncbi:hypothetical protein B0H14DRAFT_3431659 [Mycena olivaceomarginata]|nr:hypothetical protein B0H14DRAFT_3431659 [Mycena olivaceomarginata]